MALNRKDDQNRELTDKFINIVRKNTESHAKLSDAINKSTEANKLSTDKLTELILEVIKANK